MKRSKRKKIMSLQWMLVIELALILLFLIFIREKYFSKRLLEEAASPEESKNEDWWLNSGAFVERTKEGFSTLQGPLQKNSKWQKHYIQSNSPDTVDGLYPQNIFRLLTKRGWENVEQEVYARIIHLNAIDSTNRNASNGILLFQRYHDANNLYYAGIRVDGNAVIKKKVNGTYYTLALKKIYPGKYHREKNISLIPVHQWIGIRTTVENTREGYVDIQLFIDTNNNKNWEKVLEITDTGSLGGKPLITEGSVGIRTDFMDVSFTHLSIQSFSSVKKNEE